MSHVMSADGRFGPDNAPASPDRGNTRVVGTIAADIADLEAARDTLPADCELRALFDIAIQPLREHVEAICQRYVASPLGT